MVFQNSKIGAIRGSLFCLIIVSLILFVWNTNAQTGKNSVQRYVYHLVFKGPSANVIAITNPFPKQRIIVTNVMIGDAVCWLINSNSNLNNGNAVAWNYNEKNGNLDIIAPIGKHLDKIDVEFVINLSDDVKLNLQCMAYSLENPNHKINPSQASLKKTNL